MTKDEAATEFIESYDADYGNAGQNISESHKRALREGFWNGWTQGQKELVRLAREKAQPFIARALQSDELILKLSDLEAIKEELSK